VGPRRTLVLVIGLIAIGAGLLGWRTLDSTRLAVDNPAKLERFRLDQRPGQDRYLYDYARVLTAYEEGAHRYLSGLAMRFHIEALIVTVPSLPTGHTVSTLANDLFNRWRIGGDYEGCGLLVLLVDDTKTVKLEVGYALEDVFTDAVGGFVEDVELGPNYRAGDLGLGLVAVLELLEERAALKHQGGFTPEQIAQADSVLLAGGAGASRTLADAGGGTESISQPPGPGARSPEEAWETMLAQWGGHGTDLDTYTAMTRMAMGDPNHPDPRTLASLGHWRAAGYQIRRAGEHAVVWFGAVDGWDNAPFLFCNTGDGWKFDIVHQRRLIIMAEAPKWQVSQGPYPYVALMPEARQTTSKDLPLEGADLYRCEHDAELAERMQTLQDARRRNPDDAAATIELMRLVVITGQRPNLVQPLVQEAKQLAPDAPEPYKYAAIYNANTFFQYRTALMEIDRYLELRPQHAFGHRMRGFLLYRLGRYADAIGALEKAVELEPGHPYAYGLMARNYALLARKAQGREKTRLTSLARSMQQRAAEVSAPDSQRLTWLNRWLERRIG
jgi:tetratricopeptide (TPR) repeat protein